MGDHPPTMLSSYFHSLLKSGFLQKLWMSTKCRSDQMLVFFPRFGP